MCYLRFIFEELLYVTPCKMIAYLLIFLIKKGIFSIMKQKESSTRILKIISSPCPRRNARKPTAINFYSLVLLPNMARSYPKDWTSIYALSTVLHTEVMCRWAELSDLEHYWDVFKHCHFTCWHLQEDWHPEAVYFLYYIYKLSIQLKVKKALGYDFN